MADSQIWMQHLSASLTASRQLAYLYHADADKYEFMGDVSGVLDCSSEQTPTNKQNFVALICEDDVITRQIQLADAIGKCRDVGEKSFTLRYRIKRQDGTLLPLIETGVARFESITKKTTIQSLLAIDNQTIDRQKKMSRKMGFKDAVASVFAGANERQKLIHAMESGLSATTRDNKLGFLLLVAIDRLTLISEVYGSNFSDELSEKVGDILRQIFSTNGHVYKISGDVYGILLEQVPQGNMNDMAQQTLRVFLNQPIRIQERLVNQVISIGGVRLSDSKQKPTSILVQAELALQDAKSRGRACFVEYSETLGQEIRNFKGILSVGDDFLKGMRDGRVKMAYQGIVSSRTNDVSFYECLIRLIDEKGEVHSAGSFIDAVEKMGLTRLVDTFATREAIRELKESHHISLSVNVSNHTFTDPEWAKLINMELREFPEVACRLIVEITESVAMADLNQTLRVVRMLQDLGCRVALDDFGVGQTAFSQLKDLPLDIVKIDKSFVREMDRDENRLFIKTLHSLASAMNLETVGEGAETLAEADILAKDGIDHIQGYVHGMPSMERMWLTDKDKLN